MDCRVEFHVDSALCSLSRESVDDTLVVLFPIDCYQEQRCEEF